MTGDLSCDICASSFQRREHYERHIRTHTKEKPFSCTECHQTFGRIDSLSRHHSTIHMERSVHESERGKPDRRRVARACKRCSSNKIRCNGERPCERCSQQGHDCYYDPSGRRKQPAPTSNDNHTGRNITVESESTSPKRAKTAHLSSESKDQTQLPLMMPLPGPSAPIEVLQYQEVDSLNGVNSSLPNVLEMPSRNNDLSSIQDAVMTDSEYFNLTALTPLFNFAEPLDIDSWLNFSSDTGYFPPMMHIDPAFEPWSIAGNASMEDPSVPPILTAPAERSPIAQLYSRAHSPELDKDSVGPREYHPTSIEVDAQLVFPDMEHLDTSEIEQEDLAHVEEISPEVVTKITEYTLNLERSGPFPPFLEMRIPPAPVLNSWVQLYFEHFQPIFPFLHKPSFSISNTHWLLFFAVASVGAHFSKLKGAQECARAMHELIRRQAVSICEYNNQYGRELFLIQVNLLNQIGRTFSGERRGLEISEFLQALAPTLARRKGLFINRLPDHKIAGMSGPLSQKWQVWAHDEERRRTGFAIWLLDSYFEEILDLGRVMKVEELQMPLPQPEERWNAPSAQSWASGNASNILHGLEHVVRENSWKQTWLKTGTIGKQVLLQQLIIIMNTRTGHPGAPSFSEEQKLNAEGSLLELIQLAEDDKSDQPVPELKAAMVWQLIISAAFVVRKSPTRGITALALKYIYGRMDDSAWIQLENQWGNAVGPSRLAVFWAARVLHLVRSHHCAHFATPIFLLRAVLTLWLYSLLTERQRHGVRQPPPERHLVIGPRDFYSMGGVEGLQRESGWTGLKLPGIGNFLTGLGRRKLLDEAISLMRSQKAWAISNSYAQLLVRVRGSDPPPSQDQISLGPIME